MQASTRNGMIFSIIILCIYSTGLALAADEEDGEWAMPDWELAGLHIPLVPPFRDDPYARQALAEITKRFDYEFCAEECAWLYNPDIVPEKYRDRNVDRFRRKEFEALRDFALLYSHSTSALTAKLRIRELIRGSFVTEARLLREIKESSPDSWQGLVAALELYRLETYSIPRDILRREGRTDELVVLTEQETAEASDPESPWSRLRTEIYEKLRKFVRDPEYAAYRHRHRPIGLPGRDIGMRTGPPDEVFKSELYVADRELPEWVFSSPMHLKEPPRSISNDEELRITPSTEEEGAPQSRSCQDKERVSAIDPNHMPESTEGISKSPVKHPHMPLKQECQDTKSRESEISKLTTIAAISLCAIGVSGFFLLVLAVRRKRT